MTSLLLTLGLSATAVALFAYSGRLSVLTEFGTPLRAAVATVLLVLVLSVAVFLPVVAYGEADSLDPSELSLPMVFFGHYVLILFLMAWWRLRRDSVSLAEFLHVGSWQWPWLRDGVLTGVWGWLLAVTMNVTLGSILGSAGALPSSEGAPEIVTWLVELSTGAKLLIIGMAMTVEEGFFRGFLQPRFGFWPTNVLFALGHFSYGLPFLVVGVFTVSFVLGKTFERSRNLVPCIVGHGVFDGIQLFIILPIAVSAMNGAG
ncbi:MAG TPA: CPBP family intramembrane glutamic endopeptidase [Terriglobales bacterium]|nr:CPBP family intramembrane glutamic endopeptidase [Terriglobales bacterium]